MSPLFLWPHPTFSAKLQKKSEFLVRKQHIFSSSGGIKVNLHVEPNDLFFYSVACHFKCLLPLPAPEASWRLLPLPAPEASWKLPPPHFWSSPEACLPTFRTTPSPLTIQFIKYSNWMIWRYEYEARILTNSTTTNQNTISSIQSILIGLFGCTSTKLVFKRTQQQPIRILYPVYKVFWLDVRVRSSSFMTARPDTQKNYKIVLYFC